MLSIVAFQLKEIFNQHLIFFSKWHVYKQSVTLKMCHFAFNKRVNLQKMHPAEQSNLVKSAH